MKMAASKAFTSGFSVTVVRRHFRFLTTKATSQLPVPDSKEFNKGGPRKQDLFFSDLVQGCLVNLTGLDYDKVFKVVKRGQDIVAPSYAFLTDEELKEARKEARVKALRKLQMPPVMEEREQESEEGDVLEDDPAIKGYDSAQLVFTDITFGIHDRERLIVVREPDGRLRHAKGSQRDRLNQIYFPKPGRKVKMPPMFLPDNLLELLQSRRPIPDKYLYILDRNCVQFEPDHPVYIRTAEAVYDHINTNGDHESLWSTRHFGPYVFHLVWHQACDDLLVHYLTTGSSLDSVTLVLNLYRLIHSGGSCPFDLLEAGSQRGEADQIDQLRAYIRSCSKKPVKVQAALETMLETVESNRRAADNLKSAHGATEPATTKTT